MSKTHHLKTEPEWWGAVARGMKTAEFRRDDRGFEVDDILILEPWSEQRGYGKGIVVKRITHIVRGPAFGIPEGYVMLSLGHPTPPSSSQKIHFEELPGVPSCAVFRHKPPLTPDKSLVTCCRCLTRMQKIGA